jgi:site-specific recombinase XerD
MANILSVAPTALAEPADPVARVAAALLVRHPEPTRATYRRSLRVWSTWCASHDLGVLATSRSHVELWMRDLEEAGSAPATRAPHLAGLNGYYAAAVDEEVLQRNPAERVRRPKVSADSPRLGLDRDDALAMLAAAEAAGHRDHGLACLLFLNGLRVSEAIGLHVEDMATARGHRLIRIVQQGGARRDVPLAPRTARALEELAAGCPAGTPLFRDGGGQPFDRQDAWRIVRRLARRAGIGTMISPHSLRHTFGTLSLDAGVSLRDVQDAAGHSLDRHATYALANFLG